MGQQRMDVIEENVSAEEMLKKIAELDHSQSQLRDLNAVMRHWLDVADDDMAELRLENAALRKQVNALEKLLSEAQQVEGEPCRPLLADDLDVNRYNDKKIHELEKESSMMKEQNKELTAELKSLEQKRNQDKISLSKLRVALQTFEFGMEEAQLGLQLRDEDIHKKNLQLKHLEENIEESSNIIQDLRLTIQELRKQLEDRLDEASFATPNDMTREKEASLRPPLSLAEEFKLLASSTEEKPSMTDWTAIRHEETEAEELLEPHSLTPDLQSNRTKRCGDTTETVVQRAGLFALRIFMLTVLAFVASLSFAGSSDFFSINTLRSIGSLMLQPYCVVHYGALPPI